jgi:hypothetical protein
LFGTSSAELFSFLIFLVQLTIATMSKVQKSPSNQKKRVRKLQAVEESSKEQVLLMI